MSIEQNKDDGGPAFPYTMWDKDSIGEMVPRQLITGLSIRDYFAGQALNALISGNATVRGGGDATPQDYPRWAYELADAMLKERSK